VSHADNRKRDTDRTRRRNSTTAAAQRSGASTRDSGRTNSEFARILWASNAPWCPTGYGSPTAQIVPRLIKEGHETAILAMYGLEGATSNYQGIKVYPRGVDGYSNDVLVAHMQDWASGNPELTPLLLTLFDVWVLSRSRLIVGRILFRGFLLIMRRVLLMF